MMNTQTEKKYTITLTVNEDLHNYLLDQTGGSKWHRGSFIKSILYQMKNSRLYIGGASNVSSAPMSAVKTKSNKFVIGTPIFDPSKVSMTDLHSELKDAFKARGLITEPISTVGGI